jgi:hypothetical protein
MKSILRIIALVTLGCAAMATGTTALAADTATCRGGYRIMLMTPEECQSYLKQLKAVRARSDRMAELELQEWHTALLIERAEACQCLEGRSVVLLQRSTDIRQSQTN